MKLSFQLLLLLSILFSCHKPEAQTAAQNQEIDNEFPDKIGGISLVSPFEAFPAEWLDKLENVGNDWLAFSPYAFSSNESSPNVVYSTEQYWGETPEGIRTMIDYARERNLQIMLKPQVWIPGGWVGYYDPGSEENWQLWETSYRDFVMTFLEIAIEKEVELFCIGTEYRIAAQKRPDFWRNLIQEIREVYTGQLVYAANWDDYNQVVFWDDLDFIGIDSYFPLVESKTPQIDEMIAAWQPIKQQLGDFAALNNQQIIFTEFGYMSADFTAWKNWENEQNIANLELNMEGQANAFAAFFETVWSEDWCNGGFIWKWFPEYEAMGGENHKEYTPQGKPAEAIIRQCYEQY